MTCNPNWPEIKAELAPGEKVHNRPDLVARVFRAKVLALKKKIMEDHVFREVAAFMYVIEFQKRGLPHVHILIILKPEYKIKDPAVYDKFTCAEIPSHDNPHLRKIVVAHMMHGPCGKADPSRACMHKKGSAGSCKYGYPKAFNDTTTSTDNGYPLYRRRNTGESITIRGQPLDNRWVIPYNPYLSSLFDCHINVEVCSTIQAVKYLYKYIYKGHDRCSFNVTETGQKAVVNGIEQFQTGRWVSPCEAAWRIFSFDLYEMIPPVMLLQVYVPNNQTVRFDASEQLSDVVDDGRRAKTSLTKFFATNAQNLHGPKYLYTEFSEHFVWKPTLKIWKDRAQRTVISRLAFVSPSEGERYFLRLLLTFVRGPTSFGDLRTVNGVLCSTFQEAAVKLGLLDEDNAIEMCMDEAVSAKMPHALRRLFATVLLFGNPQDPLALWQKYYTDLSEDFRHKSPREDRQNMKRTVHAIETYLGEMNKTLKDFGLDGLLPDDAITSNKDISDALDAPIPAEYVAAIGSLNEMQNKAFTKIMEKVNNDKPSSFFIDGPGGTGKTYLYCALYAAVRQQGKIVLPTATSGIAASNIVTGRTAHSRFKLPLDHSVSMACGVSKQSGLADLLRASSLIIWDEASMALKENVDCLDLLLKDLCDSMRSFGGKVVVFGGDFRQVLPVVPKKSQKEVVAASLVSSHLWPSFIRIKLTENMRARTDPLFSDFLLALGNGQLQQTEIVNIRLPDELIIPFEEEGVSLKQLITEIFPELSVGSNCTDVFTDRAILTPLNEDVDEINTLLIETYPGETYVYRSFDSLIDDNCNLYTTEFLNTLCPGGISPHSLVLKVECPVILLRNLAPALGLCNGTRLICKRFFLNVLQCMISTGHHAGELVFLPRINLRPSSSSHYPFHFQRKQFPIKLSFAMTINKAQGQTLNRVGIYLRLPCFSHGQLYVGLSRARKSSQIRVLNKPVSDEAPADEVRNIVSFDILYRCGVTATPF